MKAWEQQNQKTIQRGLRIIQALPFTRMVALTGSLAEGRATEKSDIDFFVQVKAGHIWTSRLIITAILQLFGLRRTDGNISGKICLNWFAIFNAPAKQEGRIYKTLWSNSKPGIMKSILEKLLSSYIGKQLEKLIKKVQIARIERDYRTSQPNSQVRYSDTELGFHPPKKY